MTVAVTPRSRLRWCVCCQWHQPLLRRWPTAERRVVVTLETPLPRRLPEPPPRLRLRVGRLGQWLGVAGTASGGCFGSCSPARSLAILERRAVPAAEAAEQPGSNAVRQENNAQASGLGLRGWGARRDGGHRNSGICARRAYRLLAPANAAQCGSAGWQHRWTHARVRLPRRLATLRATRGSHRPLRACRQTARALAARNRGPAGQAPQPWRRQGCLG